MLLLMRGSRFWTALGVRKGKEIRRDGGVCVFDGGLCVACFPGPS